MISSVNILYVFCVRLSMSTHAMLCQDIKLMTPTNVRSRLVDAEASRQNHKLPEKSNQSVIIIRLDDCGLNRNVQNAI